MMKKWSPKRTVVQILNALFRVEGGLLLLSRFGEKRGRKNVTPPFILPWKDTPAEWHESFSLDEIYKSNFHGQIIPAPENKIENLMAI